MAIAGSILGRVSSQDEKVPNHDGVVVPATLTARYDYDAWVHYVKQGDIRSNVLGANLILWPAHIRVDLIASNRWHKTDPRVLSRVLLHNDQPLELVVANNSSVFLEENSDTFSTQMIDQAVSVLYGEVLLPVKTDVIY